MVARAENPVPKTVKTVGYELSLLDRLFLPVIFASLAEVLKRLRGK